MIPDNIKIVIVLPAYNAARTLLRTLDEIPEEFRTHIILSDYTLTHNMNDRTSIWSVLESLTSVTVGSDREFLSVQIQKNPLDLTLITLPILLGLLLALTSLVYRRNVFTGIDLRLSLFLFSIVPVYAVLKPIGYFPRYSWSFLPPALILLALILQSFFLVIIKRSWRPNESTI